MTDKQPEALRLAGIAADGPWTYVIGVRKEIAAELRRQYAEIETLHTGYEAARLEVESLKSQSAAQRWNPMENGNSETALQMAAVIAHRDAALHEEVYGSIMGAAYDFRDAHISGSMNLKRSAHAELETAVRNALRASHGQAPINLNCKSEQKRLATLWGFVPAQAAPTAVVVEPSNTVAYLDIGEGCYMDLGTDLNDEALQRLPKGRHALVIAGTYGIDGYVAAPTTQPAPKQEAQERVYLVATGETLNGRELYERHEKYVPLADCETLYTAPQPSPAAQAGVPAGYVLVPVEPTTAMLEAAQGFTVLDGSEIKQLRETVRNYWRALLAAAPQPSPAARGDALDAAKHCLEMGESFRALRRVVNLLLEARRNLGPEDHELRDRIDRLLRDDAARAAQEGGKA